MWEKMKIAILGLLLILLIGCTEISEEIPDKEIVISGGAKDGDRCVKPCHLSLDEVHTCGWTSKDYYCTMVLLPGDQCADFLLCGDNCETILKPGYQRCMDCIRECYSSDENSYLCEKKCKEGAR
jgi:hypothetical protein